MSARIRPTTSPARFPALTIRKSRHHLAKIRCSALSQRRRYANVTAACDRWFHFHGIEAVNWPVVARRLACAVPSGNLRDIAARFRAASAQPASLSLNQHEGDTLVTALFQCCPPISTGTRVHLSECIPSRMVRIGRHFFASRSRPSHIAVAPFGWRQVPSTRGVARELGPPGRSPTMRRNFRRGLKMSPSPSQMQNSDDVGIDQAPDFRLAVRASRFKRASPVRSPPVRPSIFSTAIAPA